jgi:hypothetical protein
LGLIDPVYAPDGGRHFGALAGLGRAAMGPLVGSLRSGGAVAAGVSRWVFDAAFEDRTARERSWRRQRSQVPVEYPKMMFEAFDGPTGFPNRAFARELTQPVVFVEGTSARKAPRFPEAVNELRLRLGERFTYHAVEGGHYLQLDRSAPAVSRLLRDFVKRWA